MSKPLNITIPDDLDKRIRDYKKVHGSSKKWIVTAALQNFFDGNGKHKISETVDEK